MNIDTIELDLIWQRRIRCVVSTAKLYDSAVVYACRGGKLHTDNAVVMRSRSCGEGW